MLFQRPRFYNLLVRVKSLALVCLLLLLVGAFFYTTRADEPTPVYAATSSTLNFQARLSSSTGSVVPDGLYNIQLKLYDGGTQGGPAGPGEANAGTLLWTETRDFAGTDDRVRVVNGYFSVNLGSVTAFPGTINWDQEHWLTMSVRGSGSCEFAVDCTPADAEMLAPGNKRTKLTAVPYAFRSALTDALKNGSGSLTADDLLQKAPSAAQAVSSAVAGLRIDQVGSGGLVQLRADGADIFTVAKTGNTYIKGTLDIDGATLDIGAAAQSGALVLNDGSGDTLTLQPGSQAGNLTFTLPTAYGSNGDCIKGNGSGVLSFNSCGGSSSFVNGGNAFAGLATLGTTDSNELQLITSNAQAIKIDTSGNVRIGSSGAPSEKLDVNGALRLGNTTNTNAGTIRWNGTDFQGYNGSGWLSLTGGGTGGALEVSPVANKRKAADETLNSNATLQNDNELFFGIGANETWSFRFVILANAAAAPDIKFAVTAPGGATCKIGVTDAEGAVAVGNLGCGVSSGLITGNATEDVYEIVGTVANGVTAGDVTLQWAQNTSNAASVTVRTGSYLTANRVVGAIQTPEAFIQTGNSFGTTASLGTNDNFGLSLLTNGTTKMSILANGNVGIGEANPSGLFSVGSGSPFRVDNSGGVTAVGLTSSGALSITSGGASITGGLNNNTGGITNAGSITGVGTNITASGALTIASGGGGGLTLDSASNTIIIGGTDTGLQRVAAGNFTIDLNDASATGLGLNNSGAGVANLNLNDGGLQTAGTMRLTNDGALQNITGLTFTGGAVIGGNATIGAASTERLTITSQILGGSPLVFQGATDNSFTTTLAFIDPTANNTITLPNASGGLVLDTRSITTAAGSGLSGGGNFSVDRSLSLDINGLTAKTAVNSNDYLAIYDDTSSLVKKISRSDLLQGLTGALQYRGTWNASTNTPSISDATGTEGDEYVVSVAGTQNLGSGNITFGIGDFVIHNGTVWQLAPSSSQVSSVFGRTGAVVAVNGDYTGLQITNTAAGNLSAITVQAAINELDTEKLGSLGGLTSNSQTFANDTNFTISSSGSTHTLNWAGLLAVGRGGTGVGTFATNGLVFGNGTGALQVTAAGTGGQVLLANGTGVPTFTSLSGDITIDSSGVTLIGADKVALGTDTTGDYVANLGTLTGLSTSGNSGEGSTPTLSVLYGAISSTAVQGNTTIVCPGGAGNLTGGGNTVTLGSGGTCSNLDTAAAVTFGTSVSTPLLTSSSDLVIESGGSGDITLNSASDEIIIADAFVTGSGALTLQSAATTALAIDSGTTGALNIGTGANAKTIQIGTTTGAVAQTINIGNNATASSTSTVVIGSTVGTSATTLQGGTAGVLIKGADSATAFQIQKADSTVLLTADTSGTPILKVATTAAATQSGTDLLVVDAEFTGALRVGDGTNRSQFDGTTKELSFTGTARHTKRVEIDPEYPGVTFTPDGSANVGILDSNFCSGTSRLNLNTAFCAATDNHNYYSWTSASGINDYDLYIRYTIPSDYSGDPTFSMYGWRTDSSETVNLTLFKDDGTTCISSTNAATGTAAWTDTSLTNSCTFAADDRVIFRIKLTADASEFALASKITLTYRSKW